MSNDASLMQQHKIMTIYRFEYGLNELQYGETVMQEGGIFQVVLIKYFSIEPITRIILCC